MYQEPGQDLKQKIEDLFVGENGQGLTQPRIAHLLKREMADRVFNGLAELVQEGRLITQRADSVTPISYQLAADFSIDVGQSAG